MARKRKGLPVHGWLIIDKPQGVTSTAVVNKARWALRAEKAGHAGTLDPLATGLLAVAFGEATKTVPIAQEGLKTYRFTIRLGVRTASDDCEGPAIASSDLRPDDATLKASLQSFIGDIKQVPPQFSAVKVDGERAYDLARDGVKMDLAPRHLYVADLKLTSRVDADHAELELVCGKGGYVRSIARDIGEKLGCHAHVVALRRTRSGGFGLDGALGFEDFDKIRERGGTPPLQPIAAGLSSLPECAVQLEQAARLRNGNAAPIANTGLNYGDEAWASIDGVPVALVSYRSGHLHPSRVFVI